MRTLCLVLCACWLALLAVGARAHEMTIAELELREVAPGDFVSRWTAVSDKSPNTEGIRIEWPVGCTMQPGVLRCGTQGLDGVVAIDGLGGGYSALMLRVYWADGQSRVYTLTSGQRHVRLYGAADDRRGREEIAKAYLTLGVEHILSGYDHLLFVVALLFLVGFRRQLLWTITAFTAAHSVTLASAALGLLTLRPAPVEASIALSIVLVAGEALHRRETLARRWPGVVAFLFGLVHGLGFAGALAEIGLPANYVPTALLTFNLGVEAGQLLVVGLAWLLHRAFGGLTAVTRLRAPVLYGIGGIAAYWSWVRVVGIFG